MYIDKSGKYRPFLLSILLILALLAGCTSANTPPKNATAAHTPAPGGTPLGITVPVCRLASCTNFAPVAGVRPFIDTWENIHVFQTFDRNVSDPAASAKSYDFVWGALPANVDAYRASNPNILLSYYVPMHVDDGTFTNQDLGHQRGLAYWKTVHPDWILYKCDRTTPAYEYQYSNVPFDITNPDVINWQMQSYIYLASQHGYDAIAVDNVLMENMFHACGHYDTNGNWVQRYTGNTDDAQWQDDIISWLTRMQAAFHALAHPLLLIANFSFGALALNSARIQQALAHLDGVLDEGGFTHFGEYHLPQAQWLQMMHYVDAIQRQNKPFFLINEFQKTMKHEDIEWVLGSYLMCKQRLASIYISQFQGYGSDNRIPQYSLQIGSPRDDMYQAQSVYWRDYTRGVVVVNPGESSVTISLASPHSSKSYLDPFDQPIGQTLTLPARSAKILLAH